MIKPRLIKLRAQFAYWKRMLRLSRLLGEKQTCPRRMNEWGPWQHSENMDRWVMNRWRSWPKQFPRPRSCDFCGSVHPDDAAVLIESGWEAERATGKKYKWYLELPGTSAAISNLIADLELNKEKADLTRQRPESPVPPVKLYVMHCSREQIDRLNKALGKSS